MEWPQCPSRQIRPSFYAAKPGRRSEQWSNEQANEIELDLQPNQLSLQWANFGKAMLSVVVRSAKLWEWVDNIYCVQFVCLSHPSEIEAVVAIPEQLLRSIEASQHSWHSPGSDLHRLEFTVVVWSRRRLLLLSGLVTSSISKNCLGRYTQKLLPISWLSRSATMAEAREVAQRKYRSNRST